MKGRCDIRRPFADLEECYFLNAPTAGSGGSNFEWEAQCTHRRMMSEVFSCLPPETTRQCSRSRRAGGVLGRTFERRWEAGAGALISVRASPFSAERSTASEDDCYFRDDQDHNDLWLSSSPLMGRSLR